MNFSKVAISGLLGLVTTLALLFVMFSLVNNPLTASDEKTTVKIPDVRMTNTEIETRLEDVKPEKPEEPDAPPPDLQEPEFQTPEVNSQALNMQVQVVKQFGLEGRGNLAFGGEGEYLPIVKVPPEYPGTALSRGIEGYCTVVYTVTETGSIRDPQPIESECVTKDGKQTSLFNRASVRAALKFKYKPKVVDGKPVEVPGVKNRFTYELAK